MPASDQGNLSGHYAIIPRTLIFLTSGEYVLLLKGAPHKARWANQYNGIGGHIERGEDVLSAAKRELYEETGLRDVDLWLCGVITIDTGQAVGIGLFILRGECSPREQVTSPDGTLEWIPWAGLQDLPLVEDLPIILPKVLHMQRGEPPFSAFYAYTMEGKLHIHFG